MEQNYYEQMQREPSFLDIINTHAPCTLQKHTNKNKLTSKLLKSSLNFCMIKTFLYNK